MALVTVHVGPSHTLKNLDGGIHAGNEYVLEIGTYNVPSTTVTGEVIVRSNDPKNQATLHLPDVWPKKMPSGPDCGSPNSATINVNKNGKFTLQQVKTTGGAGVIVFGSQPGATIIATDVEMDGGSIWRGSGADTVIITRVTSAGKPVAYFAANFTNRVKSCVIDMTGTTQPLEQGGVMNGKQAQGETVIRVMDVDHLQLIGITTKPWFYDGKHEWKQDVQLRPDTTLVECKNCHFYQPDIGDMTWRQPPHAVQKVVFTDCVIDVAPHVTAGAKVIQYVNTMVAGQIVNRTDKH